MDRISIVGGQPLHGTIPISGAKNAALPLMIASLLTPDTLILDNVPRLADVSLRLQQDDSFYPVLGYLVGQLAQDRIPVIDGLQHTPTEDQLKAFGAAAASSGAVALFHWVGVTPEAPSVDAAQIKSAQNKPALHPVCSAFSV